MKAPKFSKSTAGSALVAALLAGFIPSCAFKRFADRDQVESAAAHAQALEDALAILDRAIEETAPASVVRPLSLNVPAHPEDLQPPASASAVAERELSDSLREIGKGDTLFAIDGESGSGFASAATREADAGSGEPLFQTETIPPATAETPPRKRVVVNRPSPNYAPDAFTTDVIDEFRTVRTTAYSHTEADHIKYGELSAMGKPLRFGMVRSAAADWSRYPVGTRFRIVGRPYEYVIDDYGSALVGNDTIDLYKPSGERMDDWGVREVEIEIIAWGSFGKSLEILQPRKELGEHVQQMISAINHQQSNGAIADAGGDASIQPRD